MHDLKLHFDMDGLQRSRALESLTMHDDMELDMKMAQISSHNSIYIYYRIPFPEELEREDSDTEGIDDHKSSELPSSNQGYQSIGRRPRYTWDWHLPNLKNLHLAAVFAFMFDFQWLQYLPNLETFFLSTLSSTNRLHERHITLRDLLKRGQQQKLDGDGSSEIQLDRYISLPKLELIALYGHWIFEEKVLENLFLTAAPNLHRVYFDLDCTGFTLEECIALSRRMPHLENVNLRMRLTRDEIQNLGLVPCGHLQDEQRNKRRVTFYINGYVFYDVLES
ncbi:hypothetical protein BGX34_003764 [Mortierella sp. NVP85]|nr:hypothetical protein BGX34_003764 [Mortierella sp. NVP85]